MMKKIYFSILFIFVSVCSYAQTDSTQVSGIVQVPEIVVTRHKPIAPISTMTLQVPFICMKTSWQTKVNQPISIII